MTQPFSPSVEGAQPQLAPATGKQCACTIMGRVRPKIVYCLLHVDAPRMAKALTAWQDAFAGIANPAAVSTALNAARKVRNLSIGADFEVSIEFFDALVALGVALAALDKKGE